MQKRRLSRQRALQMLFQIEVHALLSALCTPQKAHSGVRVNMVQCLADKQVCRLTELFFARFCNCAQQDVYAVQLVRGVLGHQQVIDDAVQQSSTDWKLSRMTGVDRNVLRIGVYELLFESSLPQAVVINEAIEVARRFGTTHSVVFVNGVLDAVRHAHEKQV